jgi:hypothetical protein
MKPIKVPVPNYPKPNIPKPNIPKPKHGGVI